MARGTFTGRALALLSILMAAEVAMADELPTGGCSGARPAVALVPVENEPPPRLTVAPPIPSQLAAGRVVIDYCAHHLRIVPVYGEAGLKVSPRIGHLHVTVDQGPYRWVDASGEPIIVNKLPPGPHSILLELVDPTHKTLDRQVVSFTIPDPPNPR